jgi:2-furoyl-CoA dehydrogenase large subunit
VGGRLLEGASRVIIGQFFAALARKAGGGPEAAPGFFARLLAWLGLRR